MSTRILVTGGAGYIGSILTPMLLEQGSEVTVLDNFMYSQNSLLDCCANPRFSVIRGDCRDKDALQKAIRGVDCVVSLAAIVGAPASNADKTAAISTNLEAIKLLLTLRSKEQRIIYANTNSGYGVGEKGKHCTEEAPLRPISLYGKLKVEAEKAILDAGNAVSFRLATVFGMSPRMRIDLLVNDFVYRAVHDRFVVVFEGHFRRNYVHIRDVARAFIYATENWDRMKDEVYNVGLSGANLSKLELCAKIKEEVPEFVCMEAPVGQDPDKRDYIVSNEKIERTGFRPEHSLEMGIRELIKGYTILKAAKYANV